MPWPKLVWKCSIHHSISLDKTKSKCFSKVVAHYNIDNHYFKSSSQLLNLTLIGPSKPNHDQVFRHIWFGVANQSYTGLILDRPIHGDNMS